MGVLPCWKNLDIFWATSDFFSGFPETCNAMTTNGPSRQPLRQQILLSLLANCVHVVGPFVFFVFAGSIRLMAWAVSWHSIAVRLSAVMSKHFHRSWTPLWRAGNWKNGERAVHRKKKETVQHAAAAKGEREWAEAVDGGRHNNKEPSRSDGQGGARVSVSRTAANECEGTFITREEKNLILTTEGGGVVIMRVLSLGE